MNYNGLNTATAVGSKTTAIKGGKTVIDHSYPEHKVTDGALITNPPKIGGIIYEGDLGEFDYQTNTVKHLRMFVVNEDAAASATAIEIKVGDGYHRPEVGDVIMKAPTNFSSGTGAAYAITAIVAGNGFVTATVGTAIGALTKNDILVIGKEAGTGKKTDVVPNVAFPKDIFMYQETAGAYDANSGFKYYTSLYDACAILGSKLVAAIPAGARVNLRQGYSDVRIVE